MVAVVFVDVTSLVVGSTKSVTGNESETLMTQQLSQQHIPAHREQTETTLVLPAIAKPLLPSASMQAEMVSFLDDREQPDPDASLTKRLQKGEVRLHELTAEQRRDPDLVLAAAQFRPSEIEHADASLLKSKSFMLKAAKVNGLTLEFATEALRADREVVFAALEKADGALKFASKELRSDREFLRSACIRREDDHVTTYHIDILSHAEPVVRGDRDFILSLVKEVAGSYRLASPEVRADREVAATAFKSEGSMLRFAPEEFRKDRQLVLTAIQSRGEALQFASPELRTEREFNLAAAQSGGRSVVERVVDPAFRHNTGFLLEAFEKRVDIYGLLPREHQLNRDFAMRVAELKFTALDELPPEFKRDVSFVCAAVQRSKYIYQHLPENMKRDERVILSAVSVHSSPIEHIPLDLLRDKNLLHEIAETSMSSRGALLKRLGELPEAVEKTYGQMRKAYEILDLNPDGFGPAKKRFARFDNSRAIIEGRYQVSDVATKLKLREALGADYFARTPRAERDGRPLAVVIFCKEDDNGAINQSDAVFAQRDNIDNLTTSHRVAYFEVGSAADLITAMGRATERGKQRADVVYFSGHGEPERMHLAGDSFLALDDEKTLTKFTGGFVKDDGMVILGSCSTGRDNENGDCLAKMCGRVWPTANIYAPKVDGNLRVGVRPGGAANPPDFTNGGFSRLEVTEVLHVKPAPPFRFNFNRMVSAESQMERIVEELGRSGWQLTEGSMKEDGTGEKRRAVVVMGGGVIAGQLIAGKQAAEEALGLALAHRMATIAEHHADTVKNFDDAPDDDVKRLKKDIAEALCTLNPIRVAVRENDRGRTIEVLKGDGRTVLATFAIPERGQPSGVIYPERIAER